jgi:hypothetical protein
MPERIVDRSEPVTRVRVNQRLGFRMRSIERDAFTPATGYDPGTMVDGIELRDRVWLDLALHDATPPAGER